MDESYEAYSTFQMRERLFDYPPSSRETVPIRGLSGSALWYVQTLRGKEQQEATESSTSTDEIILDRPFDDILKDAQDDLVARRIREEEIQAEERNDSAAAERAKIAKARHMNALWVDTFAPQTFTELLSDEKCNRDVLKWIKGFDPLVFNRETNLPSHSDPDAHKRPNPVLIVTGPPGVGKTTLVHIAAKQAGYNVQEMNSSDERTKDKLVERIKTHGTVKNAFATKPTLLLIDEVDGIADANAAQAILDLLTAQVKTGDVSLPLIKRPVILVCNDIYARVLRPIREKAQAVKVPPASPDVVARRLREVCAHARVKLGGDAAKAMAEGLQSDVRACLNSLQFLAKTKLSSSSKALLKKQGKNQGGQGWDTEITVGDVESIIESGGEVGGRDALVDGKSRLLSERELFILSFTPDRSETWRRGGVDAEDTVGRLTKKGQTSPLQMLISGVMAAAGTLDYSRAAGTFHEHFLARNFSDPKLLHSSNILESLCEGDVLVSSSFRTQSFGLVGPAYLQTAMYASIHCRQSTPMAHALQLNKTMPHMPFLDFRLRTAKERRMFAVHAVKEAMFNPRAARLVMQTREFLTLFGQYLMMIVVPTANQIHPSWFRAQLASRESSVGVLGVDDSKLTPPLRHLKKIVQILAMFGLSFRTTEVTKWEKRINPKWAAQQENDAAGAGGAKGPNGASIRKPFNGGQPWVPKHTSVPVKSKITTVYPSLHLLCTMEGGLGGQGGLKQQENQFVFGRGLVQANKDLDADQDEGVKGCELPLAAVSEKLVELVNYEVNFETKRQNLALRRHLETPETETANEDMDGGANVRPGSARQSINAAQIAGAAGSTVDLADILSRTFISVGEAQEAARAKAAEAAALKRRSDMHSPANSDDEGATASPSRRVRSQFAPAGKRVSFFDVDTAHDQMEDSLAPTAPIPVEDDAQPEPAPAAAGAPSAMDWLTKMGSSRGRGGANTTLPKLECEPSGVLYTFVEGHTAAVRRPVKMDFFGVSS